MKESKDNVVINKHDFNIILMESFRYALPRTYTWASIECAERIIKYWNYIESGFRSQIQREVRMVVIENAEIDDQYVEEMWKKILALDINLSNGDE